MQMTRLIQDCTNQIVCLVCVCRAEGVVFVLLKNKGQLKGQKINAKPVKLEKPQKQEVEIKQRRTASELVKTMNKDIDHVYEALLNADVDLDELEPDTVLEEKWIKRSSKEIGNETQMGQTGRNQSQRKQRYPETVRRILLVPRAPVVTIMGHVDHGKTTLLDSLRKSQVAAQEAGGITIGTNLCLNTPANYICKIPCLETKGHKNAELPLEIPDFPIGQAHLERLESLQALKATLHVTRPLNISKPLRMQISLQGDNLLELAEATVTLAEVLELKGDPTGLVEGMVIESRTDKCKGLSIRRAVTLVAGKCWAKVRFMFDEYNQAVSEAGPSIPVEIMGWKDLPSAGEEILKVESEVSYKLKVKLIERKRNLFEIGNWLATTDLQPLNEQLLFSFFIFIYPPHCSGTICGFNVAANKSVQQMAAKKGIPLKLHRVIYKLIDELKDDLSSKLPPTTEENIIGSVTTLKHLKDEVLIKLKISWDPGF
uniref:Mitochondrial translational initiation factor 2 n=1 Tax=Sinocyclocheilus grahami TaxID=75366 RepID=A0A672QY55_SINGR